MMDLFLDNIILLTSFQFYSISVHNKIYYGFDIHSFCENRNNDVETIANNKLSSFSTQYTNMMVSKTIPEIR